MLFKIKIFNIWNNFSDTTTTTTASSSSNPVANTSGSTEATLPDEREDSSSPLPLNEVQLKETAQKYTEVEKQEHKSP